MKRYGIQITLPEDDPMRATHLLGEDWETFRWYDNAEERDEALRQMRNPPGFYRRGDSPSDILTKVECGET